jgi:hypothetical protein
VVVYPTEDEREDSLAVARIQLLERPVVAVARIRDESELGAKGGCGAKFEGLGHGSFNDGTSAYRLYALNRTVYSSVATR